MLNLLGKPDLGPVIPAEFIGMHFHPSYSGSTALGTMSARLWDVGCTWRQLELTEGVFTLAPLTTRVADLLARGVVEITYTLGQAPGFHTGTSPSGSAYNPTPPTLDAPWSNYCATIAAHLLSIAPNVRRVYVLWNEPNLGTFYNGTIARLVELAALARAAILAVDPDAIILSPDYTTKAGVPYLDLFLRAGGGAHIDGVAFHPYLQPNPSQTMEAPLRQCRATMDQHGLQHMEAWATEWTYNEYYVDGVLVNDGTTPMPQAQAADWVVLADVAIWQAGFRRSYFYGLGFSYSLIDLVDRATKTTITEAGTARLHFANLMVGGRLGQNAWWQDLLTAPIVTGDQRTGQLLRCFDGRTQIADLSGFSSGVDVLGAPITLSDTYSVTSSPIYVFD